MLCKLCSRPYLRSILLQQLKLPVRLVASAPRDLDVSETSGRTSIDVPLLQPRTELERLGIPSFPRPIQDPERPNTGGRAGKRKHNQREKDRRNRAAAPAQTKPRDRRPGPPSSRRPGFPSGWGFDPASWIPSSFPLPSSYETATTTATATATITATGHIDRGRCAARVWWAVRYRAASGSASPCFVHTDPSSERVGAGPGWLMSPADGDHRTSNHITLHPFRGVFCDGFGSSFEHLSVNNGVRTVNDLGIDRAFTGDLMSKARG
jgi:hypothetical protein